jgi:hypothetical protein
MGSQPPLGGLRTEGPLRFELHFAPYPYGDWRIVFFSFLYKYSAFNSAPAGIRGRGRPRRMGLSL